MIISVSRRTDIPAFYTPWFLNRIKAGFTLVRNPFNQKVTWVSLAPQDVDAFVFWTRDASMLLPHLDLLQAYPYYFHYTITGYPRQLEHRVPHPYKAIATFQALSDRIGAQHIIWRYDPIMLSNLVSYDEHLRIFRKIASHLAGKTEQVIVSVMDLYRKTRHNLLEVEGLHYEDLHRQPPLRDQLLCALADIAREYHITLTLCAEEGVSPQLGIPTSRCIDDTYLNRLFGLQLAIPKDTGQRNCCGCVKSLDIGEYHTCLHQCTYCYATDNLALAKENRRHHDKNSPLLLGQLSDEELKKLTPQVQQGELF